jgi:integrase
MSRRGTVGRRGASWFYVVDTQSEGEPRKQLWKRGFKTKGEALDALAKVTGQVREKTFVQPSKQTLGEFLAEWLEAVRPHLKPTTFGGYERNINAHVVPAIGQVKLQDLTAARLQALYGSLTKRDGGELSSRTKLHVHAVLRTALAAAVKWGRIQRNPANRDLCDAPKVRAKPLTTAPWSPEEMQRFLQANASDRHYAAWLLLATTGLRRGELLGLRWTDLDLEGGVLSVGQTLTTVRSHLVFQDSAKTDGSTRRMRLSPVALAALRTHRARQLEERLAFGPAYQDHGLVFAKEDGSPLHPEVFLRLFQRRAKAAGLPVIRLHDVRHSWATHALQAGIAPKVVSSRLGHANIRVTLDIYTHVMPALDQEAADKVEALILGS